MGPVPKQKRNPLQFKKKTVADDFGYCSYKIINNIYMYSRNKSRNKAPKKVMEKK